jgi:hypothetical protein
MASWQCKKAWSGRGLSRERKVKKNKKQKKQKKHTDESHPTRSLLPLIAWPEQLHNAQRN